MLPHNDLDDALIREQSQEKKQQRNAISEKNQKKPYNRDEDIKRRRRQKENYAKKQAAKGLTVKKYKKFNKQNCNLNGEVVSICRLNFN